MFTKHWQCIDKQNYKSLEDARLNTPFLQQLKAEASSFLQHSLSDDNTYLPRDDYQELIELCLLVLGRSTSTDREHHFHTPGAYHMARWMSKVIYCMKIYLFRQQFTMTKREINSLTEFCLFAAHVYVPAWVACPGQ
jgi:hypothetical protein